MLGPVPLDLLKRVQRDVAMRSVKIEGYAHPNEWCGYVFRAGGTFDYVMAEGAIGGGVVMDVPPNSIAQFHSHPPGFGFALGSADSLYLNRASSSLSKHRPGDVQGWAAVDGIWRVHGIRYAYVFGPTEINLYDLAALTGDPMDIHNCVTILSGADVRWPLHEAYAAALS